jgi:hypothetical protein
MSPRRSFQAVVSRLFVFAFVLSLLGVYPVAGQAPASPALLDQFVYLPLAARPGEISGTVTHNGVLAPGVQLELRYFDGATWSTRATATTNGSGRYAFIVPSLLGGQRYYIRYTNTTDSSRLGLWATKELSAYSAGVGVSMATFDIADIALDWPAEYAVHNLPVQFTWAIRSASPIDSYEFNLWDPIDEIVYSTSPLGHVNGYVLNGAPYVDQWYGWWVGVFNYSEYAVTDAYGYSFGFRWVYILASASGANEIVLGDELPLAQMLPELIDPETERPIRRSDRSVP